MPAKTKTINLLHVTILQNGIPQFTKAFSLVRSQILKIGRSGDCQLHIPFANLASEYEIFQIERSQVFLNIQKKFQGHFRNEGSLHQLPFENHKTIELKTSAFGSLQLNSYTISFRIGPDWPHLPPKNVLKQFRDEVGSFLVQEKSEILGLAGGAFASAVLFCGILVSFKLSSWRPPIDMSEIDHQFRAGFVSPKYFELAPELIQETISRSKPIISISEWVRENTLSLLGFEGTFKRVNPATVALSKNTLQEADNYLTSVLVQRHKAENAILDKPYTSIIQIPAVIGESFEGKFIRVMDKLQLMQDAASENLIMKRKIIEEMASDPDYDFSSRLKKALPDNNKKLLNSLAKIRVFKEDTDEEAMNRLFDDLHKQALALNARSLDTNDKILTRDSWDSFVSIPAGLEELNIAALDHLILSDLKIKNLTASEFGKRELSQKKQRILEPLIGEIEPHLVEKTVNQNIYQLRICYELAMRRNDAARGRVEWSWRIDSRGLISDVELLSSSIKDKQMTECMKAKIAEWKFPRPRRGSVIVKYPFEFSKG